VLFVDDDPNVIGGLRRTLHGMRQQWKMLFAGSGEEALAVMKAHPVDVIVTDMRMPGMDGATLLTKVSELYPQVIRVILSGYSDQEMALRTARSAHQFLAKPCDPETLRHTIECAYRLRGLFRNKDLLQVAAGITTLPSLPALYSRLIAELESPAASLERVGEIVAQDMAMTAKVLQLVNSAFFGLRQRVTDPRRAVTLLGINNLQALVLFMHVFDSYKPDPGLKFSLESLWQHSLTVGSLAKEIVRTELTSRDAADKALTAGVLHDIGKLLLLRAPAYRKQFGVLFETEGGATAAGEYRLWGTSHAEVGAYLLGLWGLSDSIVEAVAFHHRPLAGVRDRFTILTAVHVANVLAHGDEAALDGEYLELLGVSGRVARWAEIGREVKKRGFSQ